MPGKPSYTLTRHAFWSSFILSWALIYLLVWGALEGREHAVAMAAIVVPSAFLMIAVMLGVHRAFGSMDLRTLTATKPEGER